MELAFMVADGKISVRDAEKMLADEEAAGELYDDSEDWDRAGLSCVYEQFGPFARPNYPRRKNTRFR